MPQEIIRVCVDQPLATEDEQIRAMEIAVEENPANLLVAGHAFPAGQPPEPAELALVVGKKWKPGRTLRVRFLDGDPQVQARIEPFAQKWTQYANIKFDFGTDPDAEIRISFADSGSWSTLGTDALLRPQHIPTMNYGWLQANDPDDEYNRVVVHEFGHALGCIHEHSQPAAGIPWDKPKVYAYYAGVGWDKDAVDHNLFKKYSESQTQFSSYDPLSIMHYPVPNELTLGNFEVGWNKKLSATDREFIATAYPRSVAASTELTIGAAATQAAIGQHDEEDLFRFVVASQGSYTVETEGSTDVVMGLYGPDSQVKLIAQDDDSGRRLNAKIAATLVPGTYYLRVRHYRPSGTGEYGIRVWAG